MSDKLSYTILLLVSFTVAGLQSATPVMAQQPDRAESAQETPDQVWKVRIEGNETFPEVILKDRIANRPTRFWKKLQFWNKTGTELRDLEVRRDVVRIQRYYQRRGFDDVQVAYDIEEGNKPWKKTVVFQIEEGEPIRITDVNVVVDNGADDRELMENERDFQRASERHLYRVGNRYERVREDETIGMFADVLKNMGYPYAEVSVEADIDTSAHSAEVTIRNNTGPRARLGTIEVEGASALPDSYVMRESGLREGQQYSMSRLQDAQKELFNHHLYRFAAISFPDQPRDSTLDLNIRVREYELRSVQTQIGFGTEDLVRGQLGWTHRNAFGRGDRFTAAGRASFIEQSIHINYLFPYVFNTKSSVLLSPFIQHFLESGFELFRGGISNSFIYRYSDDLTGTATYEFTRNLELTRQSDASLPDSTLEYDQSSFQISGYYQQNYQRDRRGWVVRPYGEISGLMGEAGFSFKKISLDVRKFTSLTNSTIFAKRIQGGGIFNVPQDSLPANIRFYQGGTNSVRGWSRYELGPKRVQTADDGSFDRYVPAGGRLMMAFNAEIRQELNVLIDGLGMAVFLDGGQVWRDYDDIHRRPLQFGVGGGLRYQSPIGPVRVDVGYKINPTESDLSIYRGEDYGNRWSRIGIHFSIGQAF